MISENKTLTPLFIVYADGARLDLKYEGALKSVMVNDCLNGTGSAALLFGMPVTDFENGGVFSEESEVSILLGYKDDVKEVFSGEVTAIRARFEEFSSPQTEVVIETRLHRLKRETRARAFENKTPSQILKEIISAYGLKAEVEEFGPKYEYTEQNNAADYEYLMHLAGRYGKTVYCYDKTVYVKTEITPVDDEVVLEKGKSIITVRARAALSGQLSLAECTGWNMTDCRGFSASAGMKDIPLKIGGEYCWEDNARGFDSKRHMQLTAEDPRDEEDAKAIVRAVMQERSFRFQRCDIKTQGNVRIRAGNRITVKGLTDFFSGEYMIFSVTHTLSNEDGFITKCVLKRNFCGISSRKGNASKTEMMMT